MLSRGRTRRLQGWTVSENRAYKKQRVLHRPWPAARRCDAAVPPSDWFCLPGRPGIATALRARPDAVEDELPLAQLRRALDDLLVPRPLLYWTDFLASITCFYAGFAAGLVLSPGNPFKLLAAVVAVLALYRAVVFTHELAHLPRDRLPGFRIAWNLLCGIPLLVPSFLYSSHLDHHRHSAYGTARDGEYMPWGRRGGRAPMVLFVLSSFLGLPAGVLRFGLLAPLSWIDPRIRKWVAVSASSLVVNPRYRRDPPSPQDRRGWHLQEAGVFLYLLAVTAALFAGLIHGEMLLRLYLTSAAGLFLNSLRTLAAHRYRSTGDPLTRTQQLLDSVNYPGRSWLIPLWAPVGLRFHATHHLFPGVPYHNLAAAHDRMMAMLPPGSPYHRAAGYSLVTGIVELWRRAC
jgi:fatty acid desaturase